jgi:hypothetical protein
LLIFDDFISQNILADGVNVIPIQVRDDGVARGTYQIVALNVRLAVHGTDGHARYQRND